MTKKLRLSWHESSPHWPDSNVIAHLSATLAFYLLSILVLFGIVLLGIDLARHRNDAESAAFSGIDPKSQQFMELSRLSAELAKAIGARQDISSQIIALEGEGTQITNQINALDHTTDPADALIMHLKTVKNRLIALTEALDATDKKITTLDLDLKNMIPRINLALEDKVEELKQYKSEFFGKMRGVIGQNPNLIVEGDRFIFQSEILFDPGSDELKPVGLAEIKHLATIIRSLEHDIPKDLNWVLRIDGHTDRKPIVSGRFRSNWELSTLRATSVVHTLIAEGVSPEHLAAAGFGEFQPIDPGTSEAAYARNRRIELVLDSRAE